MASFWKQLGLLLWKNYAIRKRQIFRNCMEILWPLAIFLILVSVRRERPPENVPKSGQSIYFVPRALPSAGAVPFVQSLYCNFKDVNKFLESPQELPKFTSSVFSKFASDLSPILTNQTKLGLLRNISANISTLVSQSLGIFRRFNQSEFPITDLLGDNSAAATTLLKSAGLSDSVVASLIGSKVKFSGAVKFTRNLNLGDIRKLVNNSSLLITTLLEMGKGLCNNETLSVLLDFPENVSSADVSAEVCNLSPFNLIILGNGIRQYVSQHSSTIIAELMNITKIDMETIEMIETEINVLTSEFQELRGYEGFFSDVVGFIRGNDSGAGIPSIARDFNLREFICGKNDTKSHTSKTGNSTTTARPTTTASDTTSETTTKATSTSRTTSKPTKPTTTPKKTTKVHGGGKDKQCNLIPPWSRSDCGWGGITESQCLRQGCCFDSSIKKAKYCFCKTLSRNSCCNVRNRFLTLLSSGSGGSSAMSQFFTLALQGKILYTPDNNKTREVVGRISSFLSSFSRGLKAVANLKPLVSYGLNITESFVRNRQQLEQIESLAKIILNLNITSYDPQIQKSLQTFVSFMKKNERYLNSSMITESRIQFVKNYTNLFLRLFDELEAVTRCYNLSTFFQPVNEEELTKYATIKSNGLFLSAIVFNNLHNDAPYPKRLSYTLRYNPDFAPSTARIKSRYWRPGPGPWGSTGFWTFRYLNFGFVFLQDMIERTFINIVTNKTVSEPGIYVQPFPYPCYIKDKFISGLGNFMPLFMTLAWVYTVAMIVKSIVYEKELRLKEVMKVMGLTNTIHWTAWFITSFTTMFIAVVILTILLKMGNILIYSNPLVVIFVLLSFASASIAMAFLISVFFSKANISAACGGIIYFFTYLPYPLTLWYEETMNFSGKGLVSLFSTTAFGLSFKYISRWEEQGIGAQWSNFYKNPMVSDTFSLGWSVNFMLLDTVIYFLLMWYFEHVLPGQYGVPKPWYFPFTSSYWLEKRRRTKVAAPTDQYTHNTYFKYENEEGEDIDPEELQPRNVFSKKFENDPDMKIGVEIQNLVKVYSRGNKKALDGLNMKLFESQVTALLGHNGAGKSTTMSILTGLFPPTSGTAVVYGHDIKTDIEGVRKSLGLCPQHNVLFDQLTVEEHMWFYGRLKGMGKDEIRKEIERFLVDVGLPKKRNELSCNLSGGMKRKLSVAMAFIAESKTVILDEPTSGVDPYSRRGIWDLILKHKQGRTILLSTHYMDEADLLGDRISIISNGQLQCCGTPLFLKRCFSKGYFLAVTKDDDSTAVFDADEITKFIVSFVPGAKLNENFGTELSFILPSSARLTGEFANLFENLEGSLKTLGVKNYGISDTTLEEVFLTACEDKIDHLDDDTVSLTGPVQSRRHTFSDTVSISSINSRSELVTETDTLPTIDDVCEQSRSWGPLLWFQQYKAILIKRFHHARRSKKGFFSQILLPAIFIIAAMRVSMIRPSTDMPSLELSTAMFDKPSYVVIDNINVNNFSEKLMSAYVKSPSLGGGHCVELANCAAKNVQPFYHRVSGVQKKKTYSNCSCSSGKQMCPKNAAGPPPPSKLVDTGDTVQDVTGRDMNDYLLKTTDDYIRQRFGGATFGETLFQLPDLNMSDFALASSIGVRRNVKVWYNNKAYHALPTFINAMNNAILRANLNSTENPLEYGIVANSYPMDFNEEQLEDKVLRDGIASLFVAIFVILALAFVPASFVVYLVEDRVSKSKHLQLVSGVNPIVYWMANFSWDLINYLIPAVCCIIIFLAFNQQAYVSSENIGPTLALLFLYGWSMTPLMYPFSFFFDVPSTAYIVLIAINLFVGTIGTLATFILEFFGAEDEKLKNINTILKRALLIFPNYCLGRGLMDVAGNQIKADSYSRVGQNKFVDPFEWEMIGRNVFAMFLCGILYMIVTILFQYRFFVKPWTSKVSSKEKVNEEEDVAKERKRVLEGEVDKEEDVVLKTANLTKVYKSIFRKRKTLAVDRLNLSVQKGECFGLLGVNGAGKTSTFKMMTGDSAITAGDAFVKGHSVRTNMNSARQYMGYCPQFDALDELLTGKELLFYYAQIRGMSRNDSAKMADWAIETLGLTPYKDKLCGDYSGGNKRKLSTAIALLGSPPLIFLDEPTTGMDPGARRFLWNVVSGLLKAGKSVVLTSHSMEECETLCTRLAIMVNGEFQCLGSPQHLRSKFGTGYTVILRAKLPCIASVQDFILANFTDAKLKDHHHYMLEYQIPTTDLSLSQVFQKLEILRKTDTIEDYSVTQTTLDQIFVNFAREQIEAVQIDDNDGSDPVDTSIALADMPPNQVVV